jgi:hypothetical protein
MPTYTAPTTRTTGELISAAIFNTDLVENIKYFKDGPAFAANVTVGGTLGVTGATTLSSTVATGALTITGAATYTTNLKSTTALATPAALTATQATAFASTVSGAAIMGFGTTNDVSLMNRAGTVVLGIGPNTTTVNMTGLLTVSGFGTSSFSAGGNGAQRIAVSNTTSGTGAFAEVYAENANTDRMVLRANSALFTTSTINVAAGGTLSYDGSGGISIAAAHASGVIRFYSGGTTERARLHTNGRMTLGTATVIASASLTINFPGTNNGLVIENESDGSSAAYAIFTSAQTIGGTITRVGATAAVAYNTTSDQRLKTDHGLASNIARLRDLPIHDFDWKSDGTTDRGVFAQEAYSLYPLAVTKGTDELNDKGQLAKPWSVSYASFVPDLIVGWQQHDATISQLAARIAALETKDH